MSRRDLRTQPGVLTPGADPKNARPKGAVESVPKIGKTLAKPRFKAQLSAAPSGRVISWTYSRG